MAYKNEVYGLLGFAYLKDEIRQEAIKGIELVKNAGIDTIMITGDNKDTAYAIGMELGLIEDNDLVVTSEELSNMSVNEIKSKLPRIRIVARSLPSDKSRLVTIAQQAGYVVGMTGDGVNDAPALKSVAFTIAALSSLGPIKVATVSSSDTTIPIFLSSGRCINLFSNIVSSTVDFPRHLDSKTENGCCKSVGNPGYTSVFTLTGLYSSFLVITR